MTIPAGGKKYVTERFKVIPKAGRVLNIINYPLSFSLWLRTAAYESYDGCNSQMEKRSFANSTQRCSWFVLIARLIFSYLNMTTCLLKINGVKFRAAYSSLFFYNNWINKLMGNNKKSPGNKSSLRSTVVYIVAVADHFIIYVVWIAQEERRTQLVSSETPGNRTLLLVP